MRGVEASGLLFPLPTGAQRERHFRRREKVLGQFFTPRALAAWMVEVAAAFAPRREAALDPACGDGAFLEPLRRAGFAEVWGVDIDREALQRIADGEARRVCGDALRMRDLLRGRFDLVATNPPFSAKYGRVTDPAVLSNFELGRGRRSEAVEILFLELCVEALREGGALAIVLPEGVFANWPMRRVRAWLLERTTPLAVIGLSRRFFAAKTCVLLARKGPPPPDAEVLLVEAESDADLPAIASLLHGGGGFRKPVTALLEDRPPRGHWEEADLPRVFPLRPLGELLSEMRGGRALYGARRRFTSEGVPFLSAKTITPFGVDLSRDGRFIAPGGPMDWPGARARVGDLLFVRVGVGCIGRAAVVLREDEAGLADDYIYILRTKPELYPEFLALYIQTRFFRRQLEGRKRGTGTVTIPQRRLREILVPIPPRGLQERFARAYRDLHDRFRRGEIPHSELEALVAELERTLEGHG